MKCICSSYCSALALLLVARPARADPGDGRRVDDVGRAASPAARSAPGPPGRDGHQRGARHLDRGDARWGGAWTRSPTGRAHPEDRIRISTANPRTTRAGRRLGPRCDGGAGPGSPGGRRSVRDARPVPTSTMGGRLDRAGRPGSRRPVRRAPPVRGRCASPAVQPKWSIGPCPAPNRQPAAPARARWTKALAARPPPGVGSPRARWAATAADREHPVPWSLPSHPVGPEDHGPRRAGDHVGRPRGRRRPGRSGRP